MTGGAGLSDRARRAHGAGRAGGAYGLQGGQQGEVVRLARLPAGLVHIGHIQVPLVGHQLAGPVDTPQHPGGGHTPAVTGRRTGLRPGDGGGTRPRAGRGAGRGALGRAAAGRGPGFASRPFKIAALVTLHHGSFLRQGRRHDLEEGEAPSPHSMPQPAFLRPVESSFPKNPVAPGEKWWYNTSTQTPRPFRTRRCSEKGGSPFGKTRAPHRGL